jgi:hypothetical protein
MITENGIADAEDIKGAVYTKILYAVSKSYQR